MPNYTLNDIALRAYAGDLRSALIRRPGHSQAVKSAEDAQRANEADIARLKRLLLQHTAQTRRPEFIQLAESIVAYVEVPSTGYSDPIESGANIVFGPIK